MIDFSAIKTTPCGRSCHYFGVRIGQDGSELHCFGVWTGYGVFEWCYNDAGQHLLFSSGGWVLDSRYESIAPPPKRKVWAYYLNDDDELKIWLSGQGPEHHDNYDVCQEVEVP